MLKHYKAKKAEDGPSKMIELVKEEKNIKVGVCDEGRDKDGWRLRPLSSPLCVSILQLYNNLYHPNFTFFNFVAHKGILRWLHRRASSACLPD